jgi:hypothetical protein
MASEFDLLIMDYSFETSPVNFRGVDLTAANFDAQNGLMDDLYDAAIAIILGTRIKDTRKATVNEFAKTRPSSAFAQRELKWRVVYLDTVDPNGNGSLELPTPNLLFLDANGTHLDLSSTEGAAFVAAFEAYQRSRLGNTVTVQSVELVGRNI